VTTFGEDDADALAHAIGAIEEALAARIADGEDIPGVTRAAARPVGGAAADDVTPRSHSTARSARAASPAPS